MREAPSRQPPAAMSTTRVNAKWGFGNAPLKAHHRERTISSIHLFKCISREKFSHLNENDLDQISHLKGQFTRVVKQDQWDWYTVWALLGRPSRKYAAAISKSLGVLRSAIKDKDFALAEKAHASLVDNNIERYLDNYIAGGRHDKIKDGVHGYIYMLSARELPGLIKIGKFGSTRLF